MLMKKLCLFIFLTMSSFAVAQNDYLLAENYFNEGEFEKATQFYKKLYNKSPFNTSYLERLIACYQETANFLKAEKLLKNRINANKSHLYLYVYLGYNYERQQQQKKANENYQLAIDLLDKNKVYGGFIGRIFKNYNLLDKAILAYQKAMKANNNANYNFDIAQIYGEKGQFDKMFEAYLGMLDKNEQHFSTVQRYTSKYITDNPENKANILFRKTLLKKSVSNPKDIWNLLLSWLFTQQKEYTKAFVQEKAVYQRTPESFSTIFTLGNIAFANKEYEAAKQCFHFIVEQTATLEEKIVANIYLAKIAIATKNPETEAFFKQLFNEFGKNKNTIQLQIIYADFLTFSKNNPASAKKVLEEALKHASSKFNKARIKLKLGDILVFTGKFNKALIYFSQIQTQLKNDELAQQARFKVAETSYFKGDFDWAKAQLKVLKGSTTQLIANDAVDLFLKITDNEPVDSIPSGLKQLAKAELLSYQNKDKAALVAINKLFAPNDVFAKGLTPREVIYDDVLFFKAKTLIKLEKYDAAIVSLQKIIAADNQGFLTDDVYFMMAEVYNNHLKNNEKAQEYYQKIIFEHPTSIYLVDARKKFRKLRGDQL